MLGHKAVGNLPRQPARRSVHLPCVCLHTVVFHRDSGGIECIGAEYIGTGIKVFPVDSPNHIRTGDAEQVVVTLLLYGKVGKAFPAVIRFAQPVPLDEAAHAAVQYQNALP
ncbi:hypothetical protein Barb6_02193 [Bacteroidales bacterium Barb6]|nr:hypothetical protein Barb6_02193 [Bacteroidales bacterium Barb6]